MIKIKTTETATNFLTNTGMPTDGIQPNVTTIGNDVDTNAKYNAWHLYGCEVLKPLLQNSLELVFDDCFIGKFAVGDFVGFWKAILGAGNKCFSIAQELDGADKRRVNAVGKALISLYTTGLSDDSMLLVYTACKGYLMPSEALAEKFTEECRAKRAMLLDAYTAVPMAELRYRFENEAFAAHNAKLEATKASGRAYYASLNK